MKVLFFFFFNDTATTEIYTLSLHDALPIFSRCLPRIGTAFASWCCGRSQGLRRSEEHTSELQSPCISYAVFCLKKKNIHQDIPVMNSDRKARVYYSGLP